MSLSDVLPDVKSLSRHDKLLLIRFLADELVDQEKALIEPGQSYPVWSPETAFGAAATLMQALNDERKST
jgi:hypothetical protein